jgi:hypothetical protein
MPRRAATRKKRRSVRSVWRRLRRSRWWPTRARRRRWLRAFRRLGPVAQGVVVGLALVLAWGSVNIAYQVARKPTELFFPVSGTLFKTPSETWDAYAHLFRRHSTDVITAEFLAALAQVEASGNPIARTYWRWSWALDPFEVYRPASSAVGMYQFTDGTFEQAQRYCIHDHRVVEEGPWYAWRSCWFNELYFRVIPSHSIELTSAFLDRSVSNTLARRGIHGATRAQKQRLAALIHLCGPAAGDRYARRGFAMGGLRCGDHGAGSYVAKVERYQRVFAGFGQ